ncbi:caspase family protein, partial [Clostridium sp.]|uniref:caspase family protein n=1 Tax=Clostridium sp. TaxID=1506 RepID=UPI0026277416
MIKGLFCGVSKYNFNSELEYCNNDAKVLAKAFIDNIQIDKKNIKLSTETGEITNFKYMRVLKEFCIDTNEDDLIVVYYSGHGGVDESGNSFLFATNSCNESTYIYIDQVIEEITNAAAKSALVI